MKTGEKKSQKQTVKKTDKYSELLHPFYFENIKRSEYLMNAYKGKPFINSQTLPRYPKEGLKSYHSRLKRAVFFPFPKVIINKIIKFIEAKLHECVVINAGIEAISDNINLQGKDIKTFGIEVLKHTLITGSSTILVDSQHIDSELSLEAEKTLNIHPYAVLLKPEQVEDWEKDDLDNFIWVKIKSFYKSSTAPFGDREAKPEWIIYYKDHYTIVRENEHGNEIKTDYSYFTNEEGKRSLSRVPVFEVCFEDSIIADIVELSKRYMQIDSLTEEEFNSDLFPLWVFPENSKTVQEAVNKRNEDERVVLDLSAETAFTYNDNTPDAIPKVIELKTDAVKTKMDYKLSIKKDISDLSGIDFINSENSWKITSGESKKMDFIVTNANIAGYAYSIGSVLTKILNFIAEINNIKPEMLVAYPKQYNVSTLTDQINDIMLINNASISDLYLREAKKDFVERNCESISEEKYKSIIEEIENTPKQNSLLFGENIL